MTVKRWIISIERKNRSLSKDTKTMSILQHLKNMLDDCPHITLKEMRQKLKDELNVVVSKELIRVVLKRNNYSWKKIKYYGESKNLDVTTHKFLEMRQCLLEQGRPFVSIDETSFGRHGKVVHGYSKKGVKFFKRRLYPYVRTKTGICCLSQDGSIKYKVHQGAVNTDTFLEFLTSLNMTKDTVVLLDNCRFHHSKVIKAFALEQEITLLYTPPYSPWFNPIEFSFSLIKRNYYKHENIEKSFQEQSKEVHKLIFEKGLLAQNKI